MDWCYQNKVTVQFFEFWMITFLKKWTFTVARDFKNSKLLNKLMSAHLHLQVLNDISVGAKHGEFITT